MHKVVIFISSSFNIRKYRLHCRESRLRASSRLRGCPERGRSSPGHGQRDSRAESPPCTLHSGDYHEKHRVVRANWPRRAYTPCNHKCHTFRIIKIKKHAVYEGTRFKQQQRGRTHQWGGWKAAVLVHRKAARPAGVSMTQLRLSLTVRDS